MAAPFLKLVYDRHAEAYVLRDKHDKFVAYLELGDKSLGLDVHAHAAIQRLAVQTPATKEPEKVVSAETLAVQEYIRTKGVNAVPAAKAQGAPAKREPKRIVTDLGPITLDDLGL